MCFALVRAWIFLGETLLEGWEPALDSTSGLTYYVNVLDHFQLPRVIVPSCQYALVLVPPRANAPSC
jgi:hypothetical protein